MLVYDANSTSNSGSVFECTYTTFNSNNKTTDKEHPILILDNSEYQWERNSVGTFTNPNKRTAFKLQNDDNHVFGNILKIDARFTSLIKWLGDNRIKVKLTGDNTPDGYAVYKICEIVHNNSDKLSSSDGFLQFMIERLLESSALAENILDDELDESADNMKITSLTSISDFLNCAGITLPENIRLWARRNLAVARSSEVTPEEKRHAHSAVRCTERPGRTVCVLRPGTAGGLLWAAERGDRPGDDRGAGRKPGTRPYYVREGEQNEENQYHHCVCGGKAGGPEPVPESENADRRGRAGQGPRRTLYQERSRWRPEVY